MRKKTSRLKAKLPVSDILGELSKTQTLKVFAPPARYFCCSLNYVSVQATKFANNHAEVKKINLVYKS